MKILPNLSDGALKRFDFLHENEKCHTFFRRHGMCLFFQLGRHWIPCLGGYLLFLPVFFWAGDFFEERVEIHLFLAIIGIFGAIALSHWFFLILLEYMLGFMMITDRRIVEIHKSVFLREETSEMPFDQITNIHHDKSGFLQNILHYGTLRIDTNIDKPICMHFVPRSDEKFSRISEIHGRYVHQRGNTLHKALSEGEEK